MDNVKQWLQIDTNPETRAQVSQLHDAANSGDSNAARHLHEILDTRIVFGTAGLRARMEAGFNRMNDVTVLQASQGLAEYIMKQSECDVSHSVVIGHDHRHHSQRFAELTIAAFAHKGFKVHYIGAGNCATPMVPFAVDKYSADAGVMITASHNPKDDNGYKVYWSNGCQIIPPHDAGIQECILHNLQPVLKSTPSGWDTSDYLIADNENIHYCLDEVSQSYQDHLVKKLWNASTPLNSSFRFAYTAMHGVGFPFVQSLLHKIGAEKHMIPVLEQCSADPDFPTVNFPNPEEKGALDLAMKIADDYEQGDVCLVLANDPDADRFSVAFKSTAMREWRQLSGNEIGVLFADFVISNIKTDAPGSLDHVYLLNSTVSSQMIASMAAKRGFHFKDTLTGFKWIGNEAIALENQGYVVPFAYEEAIGFMFPTLHDKDGIAALLVFLQLYNALIAQGIDPAQRLDQLYEECGYFKQCNGYYKTPTPDTTELIFNKEIRNLKETTTSSLAPPFPTSIGSYTVIEWRDLTTGYDSTTPDKLPTLHVDPSAQMITCKLVANTNTNTDANTNTDEFVRFTVRGSGTEPKLKVYIEAKAAGPSRAAELVEDVWALLRERWFVEKYGLVEQRV